MPKFFAYPEISKLKHVFLFIYFFNQRSIFIIVIKNDNQTRRRTRETQVRDIMPFFPQNNVQKKSSLHVFP
jgi:hypothetical protein